MARIIHPHDIQALISHLISSKKQIHDVLIDLTVKEIFKIKAAGRLDFGGSEFSEAEVQRLLPIKNKPEDEYGWWELLEGEYLIQYNEMLSLSDRQLAVLIPHQRLLATGCVHPTLVVQSLDMPLRVPLNVPKVGVHIKQNARVSQIVVLEFD